MMQLASFSRGIKAGAFNSNKFLDCGFQCDVSRGLGLWLRSRSPSSWRFSRGWSDGRRLLINCSCKVELGISAVRKNTVIALESQFFHDEYSGQDAHQGHPGLRSGEYARHHFLPTPHAHCWTKWCWQDGTLRISICKFSSI